MSYTLLPVAPGKQAQKFTARAGIGLERTEHRARGGVGILFLDTAHRHAQVERINHDSHAFRFQDLAEAVRNLCGQAFLHLQAPAKGVNDSRNLAETDDFAVGDVGHVAFSEKRKHVMFTQAEHIDVFDDDHFVGVRILKQSVIDQLVNIDPIPSSQKLHGIGDPLRCVLQALAGWVFAQFNLAIFQSTLSREFPL